MNKLNTILIVAISLVAIGLVTAHEANAIRYGEVRNSVTGAQNSTVSATITLKDDNALQFYIQAFNGDLNNSRILVTGNTALSPATSVLIDNFTAGTNGTFGHFYDNNHLGTLVKINPALLPYVGIQTTKGDSGATQKLTYQTIR